MEQRRVERKMVSMDAVIACARFGLIRGRIVDLGMGGGYIKAETSIVPIGSEVTVTFQPDSALCSDCLTVNGRVSHQSLHGFGIEFHGLDRQCEWVLRNFLPGMPPVPARAAPVLRAI
jgi:hypothetical protein